MIKYLFSILFLSLIFFPCICMAQPMSECPNDMPCINNPLGGDTDINILIGQVINAVLGIVGSLALVMFIYGGFTWMLAAGNNEKVQKGKDILIWATIGLVVIFSAYALVKFVFAGLGVA